MTDRATAAIPAQLTLDAHVAAAEHPVVIGFTERGLGPTGVPTEAFGAGTRSSIASRTPAAAMAFAELWSFSGKVTAVKYPVGDRDKAGFEVGGEKYFFPVETPEPNLGRLLAALERSKRCESNVRGNVVMGEVREFWEVATPK